MNDALHMLIGAGLVVIGVLASALADRIRGDRARRGTSAEGAAKRAITPPKLPEVRAEMPVIATVVRKAAEAREEVVSALTGAGYKKGDAARAVDACSMAERESLEAWTRSALRRAQGGAS